MTTFLLEILVAALTAFSTVAAEPAAADAGAVAPKTADSIAAQEVMRTYLQLQEKLHATQLAVERTRQDAEAAAARNAETIATRLQLIQESLSDQRAREFEAIQSTNRMMLIVAGIFAGVGFLAMVFTAWVQWRTAGKFTELAANLPNLRAIGQGWNPSALGAGEAHISADVPREINLRLSGAIERLEKRILELEHSATPPLPDGKNTPPDSQSGSASAASDSAAQITLLLGKGQSLLNLDKTDEAVACFDEVLLMDQNNTDALVKKGVALERQRKLNEAIECYDRAIAADDTVAIAYLYKGGICNRLERFSEALECYEHALRAQEKRRAA
ncbi:MAG TPA: tetratricopeptide repeat protein [Verrucomicrobiota bacterium]|nr:tetratricopeptide repeat protein [Verrucomicrobiota bacterium]